MTHPKPETTTPAHGVHETTVPAKQHGDPLLAASEGATEGTEGSRHGHDATEATRQDD